MWTEITRRQYESEGRRYTSDATDDEWDCSRRPLTEGALHFIGTSPIET